MSATSKHAGGGSVHDAETVLLWSVLIIITVAVAAMTAAVHLGAMLDGDRQALPANPFKLALKLADGTLAWPTSATLVLVAIGALLALLALTIGAVLARRRRGASRVDRAARRMGQRRDIAPVSKQGATVTAKRLGVQTPGLPLGRTIAGDQALFASWEDVGVDIAGPRTGKTTGGSITAILSAPGAVVATSNKRDLVDATRDPRASHGEVWVFDPQQIVDEPADWWWNPLSYVTDEVKAQILADIFTTASRDPNAKTDAYFEPAASELLANLLLAAALAKRPITQVYLWLTDPTEDEPVDVLHSHGFELLGAGLREVINAPEKQRGGVYGIAKQIASFLTNRQAVRWVTSGPLTVADEANPWLEAPARREFYAHDFVRTHGTLYSISREGIGSAGPLVTALTVAVMQAAEDLANDSPGGRLTLPLVAVLDEAANVCRWRQLPNLYSHYGSKGICVMTFLQSWSQGVEVWGREGMRKLWSAANVKIFGGGVAEGEFLEDLSKLIGDYQLRSRSVSHGRGGRSSSVAVRPDRILDVADLAALPKGRAVVFASGARPTLVRRIPWMEGPHAAAVRASIRAHDPAANNTINDLGDANVREHTSMSR